ncbi:phosphatase PAP2 family protein [Baekduia soli]|uniref:Phosphatase PAP2 family protein n=1 Tax=Baekduia soli TaxID=496014 RepID=A0A5B8U692_9ACTN|nr:phosphatase PAP2 family protein [Baekduia soli]QEC48507.1 phosphatase PAP2 family protein [Baekduia soli]
MLRRPRPPLLLAAVCAVALAVSGVLARLVPVGSAGDRQTLDGFRTLDRPRLTPLLDHIAHLADPAPYALAGLVLALIALGRRRPLVAATTLVLFFLTGFTTEHLKVLVASPGVQEWTGDSSLSAASWPSGHSTAAMTIALCAVMVSPQRLRPTVAVVGGGFAIAVGYAILALGWHLPSDVFGGFLVAGTYVLLALSGLALVDRRRPGRAAAEGPSRPADLLPAAGLAAAAAVLAAALAVTRPRELLGYAAGHTTFVVGAAAIAALGALLAAGLAAGFRGGRSSAV